MFYAVSVGPIFSETSGQRARNRTVSKDDAAAFVAQQDFAIPSVPWCSGYDIRTDGDQRLGSILFLLVKQVVFQWRCRPPAGRLENMFANVTPISFEYIHADARQTGQASSARQKPGAYSTRPCRRENASGTGCCYAYSGHGEESRRCDYRMTGTLGGRRATTACDLVYSE